MKVWTLRGTPVKTALRDYEVIGEANGERLYHYPHSAYQWVLHREGEAYATMVNDCTAAEWLVTHSCAVPQALEDAAPASYPRNSAGRPIVPKKRKPKGNPRDKFIYGEIASGKTLSQVLAAVNAKPEWSNDIMTEQGIHQAAKRYARRHGKKWPLS